jgi:hypothetical protein
MKSKFTQALIELGAAAKTAQELAAERLRTITRQAGEISQLEHFVRQRDNDMSLRDGKIASLKQDKEALEASLRVKFGKQVTEFEDRYNKLKQKFRETESRLVTERERAVKLDTIYADDYEKLWDRINFARKFISKKGHGREFGQAVRRSKKK